MTNESSALYLSIDLMETKFWYDFKIWSGVDERYWKESSVTAIDKKKHTTLLHNRHNHYSKGKKDIKLLLMTQRE